MSEDIVSIGRVVEKMFGNLSVEDTRKAVTITNEWKKIVSRIKPSPNSSVRNENIGNNLADHSRVVDLKTGVLLVEADHPGWISLLQFYKSFIPAYIQNRRNIPANFLFTILTISKEHKVSKY